MRAEVSFHGLIQHAAVGQRIESASPFVGQVHAEIRRSLLTFSVIADCLAIEVHLIDKPGRKIGFTKRCCYMILSSPTTAGCTSHIGPCIPKRRPFPCPQPHGGRDNTLSIPQHALRRGTHQLIPISTFRRTDTGLPSGSRRHPRLSDRRNSVRSKQLKHRRAEKSCRCHPMK